jgi:ribosomal protein S6 kinase beta
MLVSGVYHIHRNGVVHRDIKPENVLMDAQGKLKIIDFGLSKNTKIRDTEKVVVGTELFMAPEIFE